MTMYGKVAGLELDRSLVHTRSHEVNGTGGGDVMIATCSRISSLWIAAGHGGKRWTARKQRHVTPRAHGKTELPAVALYHELTKGASGTLCYDFHYRESAYNRCSITMWGNFHIAASFWNENS